MPRRRKATELELPTTGITLNYPSAVKWIRQAKNEGLGGLADEIRQKAEQLGVENDAVSIRVRKHTGEVTGNAAGIRRWLEALGKNATATEKAWLVGLYQASQPKTRPRKRVR